MSSNAQVFIFQHSILEAEPLSLPPTAVSKRAEVPSGSAPLTLTQPAQCSPSAHKVLTASSLGQRATLAHSSTDGTCPIASADTRQNTLSVSSQKGDSLLLSSQLLTDPMEWQCTTCTYINTVPEGADGTCAMCMLPRTEQPLFQEPQQSTTLMDPRVSALTSPALGSVIPKRKRSNRSRKKHSRRGKVVRAADMVSFDLFSEESSIVSGSGSALSLPPPSSSSSSSAAIQSSSLSSALTTGISGSSMSRSDQANAEEDNWLYDRYMKKYQSSRPITVASSKTSPRIHGRKQSSKQSRRHHRVSSDFTHLKKRRDLLTQRCSFICDRSMIERLYHRSHSYCVPKRLAGSTVITSSIGSSTRKSGRGGRRGRSGMNHHNHHSVTVDTSFTIATLSESTPELPWESVLRVRLWKRRHRLNRHFGCPVCLMTTLLVPLMTPCGHLFCGNCLLHHLLRDLRVSVLCSIIRQFRPFIYERSVSKNNKNNNEHNEGEEYEENEHDHEHEQQRDLVSKAEVLRLSGVGASSIKDDGSSDDSPLIAAGNSSRSSLGSLSDAMLMDDGDLILGATQDDSHHHTSLITSDAALSTCELWRNSFGKCPVCMNEFYFEQCRLASIVEVTHYQAQTRRAADDDDFEQIKEESEVADYDDNDGSRRMISFCLVHRHRKNDSVSFDLGIDDECEMNDDSGNSNATGLFERFSIADYRKERKRVSKEISMLEAYIPSLDALDLPYVILLRDFLWHDYLHRYLVDDYHSSLSTDYDPIKKQQRRNLDSLHSDMVMHYYQSSDGQPLLMDDLNWRMLCEEFEFDCTMDEKKTKQKEMDQSVANLPCLLKELPIIWMSESRNFRMDSIPQCATFLPLDSEYRLVLVDLSLVCSESTLAMFEDEWSQRMQMIDKEMSEIRAHQRTLAAVSRSTSSKIDTDTEPTILDLKFSEWQKKTPPLASVSSAKSKSEVVFPMLGEPAVSARSTTSSSTTISSKRGAWNKPLTSKLRKE